MPTELIGNQRVAASSNDSGDDLSEVVGKEFRHAATGSPHLPGLWYCLTSEWPCRAGLSADVEPGPGDGILESRPDEVDLVGLAVLGYGSFGPPW